MFHYIYLEYKHKWLIKNNNSSFLPFKVRAFKFQRLKYLHIDLKYLNQIPKRNPITILFTILVKQNYVKISNRCVKKKSEADMLPEDGEWKRKYMGWSSNSIRKRCDLLKMWDVLLSWSWIQVNRCISESFRGVVVTRLLSLSRSREIESHREDE